VPSFSSCMRKSVAKGREGLPLNARQRVILRGLRNWKNGGRVGDFPLQGSGDN